MDSYFESFNQHSPKSLNRIPPNDLKIQWMRVVIYSTTNELERCGPFVHLTEWLDSVHCEIQRKVMHTFDKNPTDEKEAV